jgi:peptidoglycan/xylan/chitin deacetylase (PgdA/CDA1 family)
MMRRIKYRLVARALILIYHRVTELTNDPNLLAVTPANFAKHMEFIREHCFPTRLQQLTEALQDGIIPNRAVVITFDDGYADNLHQAMPLLERYEVPATVFIVAGQVGSSHEFWWDELDRLLLQPGKLPPQLCLHFAGSEVKWDQEDANNYTLDDFQRFRDWHIEREQDPTPRHRLFRELYEQLHSMPDGERQIVMNELRTSAQAEPGGRQTHRTLSTDEVIRLGQSDLIEIGAHTMNHPDIASLSPVQQRQEIQQSKEYLESVLNHPITSFAFPYGTNTPETIAILREVEFERACTTHADAVWPGASRFQLPRLVVRDWDYKKFASWLSWWMDG